MFELAWCDDVQLQSWVRQYARFRYGKPNPYAEEAWETLRTALYSRATPGPTLVTAFPTGDRKPRRYPAIPLAKAWRLLLQAGNELTGLG